MLIKVDRNTVAAGDDADPHAKTFDLPSGTSLADVVAHVLATHYLAAIRGGEATWILTADQTLGIVAQQWDEPRFLVDATRPIRDFSTDKHVVSLFFRYRGQNDPDKVFAHLVVGREPPR
jgi:hypothetical protein